MTLAQAFEIVAQMVANAPATLSDHQIAQQALRTLKASIDTANSDTPEGG